MQILFILLGLIGVTMTFFGAKWTYKSYIAKEIISFPLVENEKEFEIEKAGLFTLCIMGGGYINKSGSFRILIKNKDNRRLVDLKENFMKLRFQKNWKIGVEYFQFNTSSYGLYKVKIENPEDLVVKKSMLKIKQVFQSPIPIKNIEILIKETIPVGKKLFGILFLVLGVNLSGWGVVLGINPNLFG